MPDPIEPHENSMRGGAVSLEPTVIEIDATHSEREVLAENAARRGRKLF